MTDPIEAAKDIAHPKPDPPCTHADFQMRRPCCAHRWRCEEEDAETNGLTVTGDYCRDQCPCQEEPE